MAKKKLNLGLSKEETAHRNELIYAADPKAVNIDNTMVNLFMLLRHNGQRPKLKARTSAAGLTEMEDFERIFSELAKDGHIKGFAENRKAGELWLRSNLLNMVSRGKKDKERISSLRPIHLESYRLRNAKHTRDYNTADQVFLMLEARPEVKKQLKNYLREGWDEENKQISGSAMLDVDAVGVLHLVKKTNIGYADSADKVNKVRPLLPAQAELYCDDVERLLAYKRLIPRNVLIDYLTTITAFHLALYLMHAVKALPKIVAAGKTDIEYDNNFVVDTTDDFDSKVSYLAASDTELFINSLYEYFRATFQVNAVFAYLDIDKKDNSDDLAKGLATLVEPPDDFETAFKWKVSDIRKNLSEEDQELYDEVTKFNPTYFSKYVSLLLYNSGAYQYRYHKQLFDQLTQKNSEQGILAQGRSRRHPRRFVLGTRLLETLIQILALEKREGGFVSRSLSVDELAAMLRDRYGMIINGLNEPRFEDAYHHTHKAFEENMKAFKHKLRLTGFYNDLSDAYILQKIRPRYKLAVQN